MTSHKLAVGYARCSDPKQVEKGASIPAQKDACTRTAESNLHRIIEWFEDAGVSGTSLKGRMGLSECLAFLAKNRDVKALYVYDASRLARNLEDAVTLRRRLKRLGVQVICAGQGAARDEIMAVLVDGIFDTLAEVESRTLGRRVRRGQHQALRDGYWPRSQVPYGYLRVPVEISPTLTRYRLEVEPGAAEIVRRIFQMSLDGDGDKTISAVLTRSRVPPPSREDLRARRPSFWRPKHAMSILKNPIYAGIAVLTTRDRDSRKITEQEQLPGIFPPIVSEETFRAVQVARRSRFRNPKSDPGGNRSGRGLFRPVLRCGVCGGPITLTGGCDRRRRRIWYYGCRNRSENRESCTGLTTRMTVLDALLSGHVEADILTEDALRKLAAETIQRLEASGHVELDDAREKARAKLDEAEAALANLARVVAAGLLGDAEVAAEAQKARLQKEEAERALAEMPAAVEIPTLEDFDLSGYRAALLERWHAKDLPTRRKAIQRLIDSIELRSDGTAVIYYRGPGTGGGGPYPHHAPYGPPYAPMSARLPSGSVSAGSPASMPGLPAASVRSPARASTKSGSSSMLPLAPSQESVP